MTLFEEILAAIPTGLNITLQIFQLIQSFETGISALPAEHQATARTTVAKSVAVALAPKA